MNDATAIVVPLNASPVWDEYACIQGCIHNHLPSQEMFYRHFYPVMMALVLRYTTDKDEAGTILNNGFLKAFKNIGSFRNEGSLEGWLRRIMVHAVSDHFRYKHPPKEILKDQPDDSNATQVLTPVAYDYNKLLQLLSKLPPATRTVINLFIIDGYSHKEISAMMGITVNTSKWHVAEGRKILQEQLKQYSHG